MRSRLSVWVLLLALAGEGNTVRAATLANAKPILVHYMPWFVAKPFSGSWGYHWTLNSTNYNPDRFEPDGRRQIASRYYPLIGPYDSLDPAVLEYHVTLMKLAGVDGVIADWYGEESLFDYGLINERTAALAAWTRKAGLKFAICYEDQTVRAKIDHGYLVASNAVASVRRSMLHLQSRYFADPLYLRLGERPVLLDFGPIHLKNNADWVSIFSVLSNSPAFFTENTRYPVAQGAFAWPPMWLSSAGVLSTNSLNSYLTSFETAARSWPASVAGAFPRFHDNYAPAGLPSYGVLDDRDGRTLRETLARALTNRSDMVQIVTWNDFGEGTVVEPTREFGFRDLGIVQECRRRHLDPAFARTTKDLSLAYRLYGQRKKAAKDAVANAELDRVFGHLISGELTNAEAQFSGLEARRPVFYALSASTNELRVAIGGYLGGGASLLESDDLISWRTVEFFPPGTNAPALTVRLDPHAAGRYYRVE